MALDALQADAEIVLPGEHALAVITFDGVLEFTGEPGEVVILIDLEVFA